MQQSKDLRFVLEYSWSCHKEKRRHRDTNHWLWRVKKEWKAHILCKTLSTMEEKYIGWEKEGSLRAENKEDKIRSIQKAEDSDCYYCLNGQDSHTLLKIRPTSPACMPFAAMRIEGESRKSKRQMTWITESSRERVRARVRVRVGVGVRAVFRVGDKVKKLALILRILCTSDFVICKEERTGTSQVRTR